jgi:hypothetical protein
LISSGTLAEETTDLVDVLGRELTPISQAIQDVVDEK